MYDVLNKIDAFWLGLHDFQQSGLVIMAMLAGYFFLRHIVIHRIEILTDKTENDLDDRLIDFAKQFLWVGMFVSGLVWVLKINGISVGPILAGGVLGVMSWISVYAEPSFEILMASL